MARKLAAPNTPGSTAYQVGPQDVLQVSVYKVAELDRVVQVSDAGTINMPLVGEIQAGGLTARGIERILTRKLGAKYLQNPQVTVFVKEHNSQRVTVEGAVKKPGMYPLKGPTSLLEFVAVAGGFEKTASETDVVIIRNKGGKRTAAKFDLSAIRAGKTKDPSLRSGDVIVVSQSGAKVAMENMLKVLPVARAFVPLL
ncbi:MAG: polysaccharide biosynthesis/export family protein [Pseudomonadota bacterium]